MFEWWKKRRREKLLAEPFPEAWGTVLRERVPYYTLLNPQDQARLREIVRIFIAEKHFEGCAGFKITDEVRVTIAGHAACLLLQRENGYFPSLRTILVYPASFYVEDEVEAPDGTVAEVADEHLGQSWDLGVVVLAWQEVLQSSIRAGDGFNVVLHEFAHQLDVEATGADGAPWLADPELRRQWAEVMQAEYERLHRDLGRGRRTVLDPYAAEDPAEFFAVATETFFELPDALKAHHPQLYHLLSEFYRQDPAALIAAAP